MRWKPRLPEDPAVWYWTFALVPHKCNKCEYKFWLERGMRQYRMRYNPATPNFMCYRCATLAEVAAVLPRVTP